VASRSRDRRRPHRSHGRFGRRRAGNHHHAPRPRPRPADARRVDAPFTLGRPGGLRGDDVVNVERDYLFTKESVEGLVNIFLGDGGDRRDPFANPLYADLTGLPPVYIQVGDQETLLDDSRSLAERLEHAGVDVRIDVFSGQQHTFQMVAGRVPEADDAIQRLAEWVKPKIGLDG
jgi:acetyl esterase/lipase